MCRSDRLRARVRQGTLLITEAEHHQVLERIANEGSLHECFLRGRSRRERRYRIFFFAAAPQLLVFLPYPMTNYHACNVLPFVATRDTLPAARVAVDAHGWAVPVLIAVYLVCGSIIKLAGRAAGLDPG